MVELLEYLQKEGAAIVQAPVLFAIALTLAAAVIRTVLRREFTIQISNLEHRTFM
ncbi:hypothetical protein [Mesorhizobium sp. M1E.F.Ca.ET.045.02.1.1]|uniref:hypothetical protein n=1 Tax=Mesorhizobium sp. M1E.F.Ca.ET.045.02.1.1 TaxID=2493672 RepID=UPI001679C18D|nr:hypothetical protein [Mesorhizobium sp. M1E.F.Ca.ET.045.02.1.1]